MVRNRLRSFVIAMAAVALVAGAALAVTVKVKVTHLDVFVPGVNGAGNISGNPALGAMGTAKLTFNSKSGRLKILAHARVTNLSNHKQKYENVGIIPNVGDIVKDDFKVSAKGKATYKGLSKNIVI